ncbi:MAG: hypothetical protein P8Z80_16075 [Pseudolabrys sp.]|jgi:hypothetical protein
MAAGVVLRHGAHDVALRVENGKVGHLIAEPGESGGDGEKHFRKEKSRARPTDRPRGVNVRFTH